MVKVTITTKLLEFTDDDLQVIKQSLERTIQDATEHMYKNPEGSPARDMYQRRIESNDKILRGIEEVL